MTRIRLTLDGRYWHATKYISNAAAPGGWMLDPETFDLFGTHTLPLPYTVRTSACDVARSIALLNPGAIVERG